jgi:hypothetical protein
MEHYEKKYEVVQTPCKIQCVVPSTPGTATQITIQSTPIRTSSAKYTPRDQQTLVSSPSSSTYQDPTLANMLPIKTRSLRDIYNEEVENLFLAFAWFSQIDDPLTFEEAVKDDVWTQAMDE